MCNEVIRCGHCHEFVQLFDCGSLGACDENVFCADCETEINSQTGDVALLCGRCDACKTLMVEGSWGGTQDNREAVRLADG